MKFLVPNYSCLQNPWLGATAPRSPFSLPSVLNWICWTPSPEQNSWERHWCRPRQKFRTYTWPYTTFRSTHFHCSVKIYLGQHPRRRTTSCLFSATAYSVHPVTRISGCSRFRLEPEEAPSRDTCKSRTHAQTHKNVSYNAIFFLM